MRDGGEPSWVDYLGFGMMLAMAIIGGSIAIEGLLK